MTDLATSGFSAPFLADNLPESDDSDPTREIYLGMAAAFLTWRVLAAKVPMDFSDPVGTSQRIWDAVAPAWLKTITPTLSKVFLLAAPVQLATEDWSGLGVNAGVQYAAYLNASCATAAAAGYAYARQSMSDADAAAAVREAYGLDEATLKAYLSQVMRREPHDSAQRFLTRALLRRADLLGISEGHHLLELSKALLWSQLRAQGKIKQATRVWLTAEDERVCPVCAPLDNQEVDLDAPFIHPVTGHKYLAPGLHPRCRCVVVLRQPEYVLAKNAPGDPYDRNARGEFARRESRQGKLKPTTYAEPQVDVAELLQQAQTAYEQPEEEAQFTVTKPQFTVSAPQFSIAQTQPPQFTVGPQFSISQFSPGQFGSQFARKGRLAILLLTKRGLVEQTGEVAEKTVAGDTGDEHAEYPVLAVAELHGWLGYNGMHGYSYSREGSTLWQAVKAPESYHEGDIIDFETYKRSAADIAGAEHAPVLTGWLVSGRTGGLTGMLTYANKLEDEPTEQDEMVYETYNAALKDLMNDAYKNLNATISDIRPNEIIKILKYADLPTGSDMENREALISALTDDNDPGHEDAQDAFAEYLREHKPSQEMELAQEMMEQQSVAFSYPEIFTFPAPEKIDFFGNADTPMIGGRWIVDSVRVHPIISAPFTGPIPDEMTGMLGWREIRLQREE